MCFTVQGALFIVRMQGGEGLKKSTHSNVCSREGGEGGLKGKNILTLICAQFSIAHVISLHSSYLSY